MTENRFNELIKWKVSWRNLSEYVKNGARARVRPKEEFRGELMGRLSMIIDLKRQKTKDRQITRKKE